MRIRAHMCVVFVIVCVFTQQEVCVCARPWGVCQYVRACVMRVYACSTYSECLGDAVHALLCAQVELLHLLVHDVTRAVQVPQAQARLQRERGT